MENLICSHHDTKGSEEVLKFVIKISKKNYLDIFSNKLKGYNYRKAVIPNSMFSILLLLLWVCPWDEGGGVKLKIIVKIF